MTREEIAEYLKDPRAQRDLEALFRLIRESVPDLLRTNRRTNRRDNHRSNRRT